MHRVLSPRTELMPSRVSKRPALALRLRKLEIENKSVWAGLTFLAIGNKQMGIFHRDNLPPSTSLSGLSRSQCALYPVCSEFEGLGRVAEVFHPVDVWFAAEPGELAFGVVAMALLRGGDGFGLGEGAVDCGEGLAVAERVQGFDAAVLGEEGAGFFDEAGREHGCCALVDAVVELLAGWV